MKALFLAQSDTTVGFLCRDDERINALKGRENRKVLLEVDSLTTLKALARVPQKYKNQVRRTKKTTFIYPNQKAIRVINDGLHQRFLSSFGWIYSSSANQAGKDYDPSFAFQNVDVVILDERRLSQGKASQILRINTHRQKRIR